MIQKPKGTYDVFEKKGENLIYLHDLIQTLMEKYRKAYPDDKDAEREEIFLSRERTPDSLV